MTSPPTNLCHGQSEWNHLGRVTGQTDIALSTRGIEQSAGSPAASGGAVAAIFTSGLARRVATAMPIAAALGLEIRQRAALDEIHIDVLQGRFRDERDPPAQALLAAWQGRPWGPTVPGGECLRPLSKRVLAGWRAILDAHTGEAVLLVGYRATNRVPPGRVLGWVPDAADRHLHPERKPGGPVPRGLEVVVGGSGFLPFQRRYRTPTCPMVAPSWARSTSSAL